MLRKISIPMLAVTLAVALSGCKSSSSTQAASPSPAKISTSSWAKSLCTDLGAWKTSTQAAAARIKSAPTASAPVDEIKGGVNDAITSTETLVTQLKDLGVPDTSSGQQAATIIKSLASSVQTQMETIKGEAGKLNSSTSVTELGSTLATIAGQLDQLSTQIKDGFSSLQQVDVSGELNAAVAKAPSCQTLTGSAGAGAGTGTSTEPGMSAGPGA